MSYCGVSPNLLFFNPLSPYHLITLSPYYLITLLPYSPFTNFYINCNAIDGCWFAVDNNVAAACCNICCLIYCDETFAISASFIVDNDEVKLLILVVVLSNADSSLFDTEPNSVSFLFKVSRKLLIVEYAPSLLRSESIEDKSTIIPASTSILLELSPSIPT